MIVMTSTISSKGQITVPKAVRRRLGLRTGTTVEFELVDEGVLLRKSHAGVRPVDRVRGILARSRSTEEIVADMRGLRRAPSAARR
jgi:AbrB family looped-hinge helix DNA binding protein